MHPANYKTFRNLNFSWLCGKTSAQTKKYYLKNFTVKMVVLSRKLSLNAYAKKQILQILGSIFFTKFIRKRQKHPLKSFDNPHRFVY